MSRHLHGMTLLSIFCQILSWESNIPNANIMLHVTNTYFPMIKHNNVCLYMYDNINYVQQCLQIQCQIIDSGYAVFTEDNTTTVTQYTSQPDVC